jgi:hypothetical protein
VCEFTKDVQDVTAGIGIKKLSAEEVFLQFDIKFWEVNFQVSVQNIWNLQTQPYRNQGKSANGMQPLDPYIPAESLSVLIILQCAAYRSYVQAQPELSSLKRIASGIVKLSTAGKEELSSL